MRHSTWRAGTALACHMLPMVMNQEPIDRRRERSVATDRPFYSTLLLAFGPVVQIGGWLAAFTDIGAAMAIGGALMSVAGGLVYPTPRRILAAGIGVFAGGGWILALPVVVK